MKQSLKPIILLITLLFGLTAIAKDYSLIPYRLGDKWGYCNKGGEIQIKPQFERSYWFADNGLAKVMINGKYGYINKKSKIKIEAKFDEASDFIFSSARVVIGNQAYCMNESGYKTKTEIEKAFRCSQTEGVEDGNSLCSNCCETFEENGKYGITCTEYKFDESEFKVVGQDSIPANYDTIYSSIGYSTTFMPLIASKEGKLGIIDAKNKIVKPFECDSIRIKSYNTFLLKKEGKWALHDTSGALYTDITNYNSHFYYTGDYFAVEVDGKWGVVNAKGKLVIPHQFEYIKLGDRHIIQREFVVKHKGKWGYISDGGNISAIYDTLEPFNGYEYTHVTKNGKEGYIDKSGVEYFED